MSRARAGPGRSIPGFAATQHGRARCAAARLINADPGDIALISSVSYGVATAAKVLTAAGRHARAAAGESGSFLGGARMDDPALRPKGSASTSCGSPMTAIGPRRCSPRSSGPVRRRVALASISCVHWSDGGIVDIERVAAALRAQGAALLVDATHAVGIIALDVRTLNPDFLVFPTYKWLLGPYGRAFLYIAKRHQDGVPLEQTAYGRREINSERSALFSRRRVRVRRAALRHGRARSFHLAGDGVRVGMEMMAEWGAAAVEARLAMLTARLADGLRNSAALVPDPAVRAPHILSLRFPNGMPAALVERLAAEQVHVAPRVGRDARQPTRLQRRGRRRSLRRGLSPLGVKSALGLLGRGCGGVPAVKVGEPAAQAERGEGQHVIGLGEDLVLSSRHPCAASART